MSVEIDLCLDRDNTNLSDFYLITFYLQKGSIGPWSSLLLESLVMKSRAQQYLDRESESINVLVLANIWDQL